NDHLKPVVPQEEKPKEVDRWPTLDKNTRRELYAMIKDNNEKELAALVKQHSDNAENEVIDYLSSFRLSDGSTFLHLAAKNSCDRIVKYLLEVGCDPCIKNEDDMVAYAMSPKVLLLQVSYTRAYSNE
ncbi:ankyrin repeat protein, partial [Ancylostoma duodenale]